MCIRDRVATNRSIYCVLARPCEFNLSGVTVGSLRIMTVMKQIVILISGGGSNMQAIARTAERDRWEQTLHARIAAVISNRPDAKGLQRATTMGLTTQVVDHTAFADSADPRTAFDDVLRQTIDAYEPSLVVLAGFMRILLRTNVFARHSSRGHQTLWASHNPASPCGPVSLPTTACRHG